MIPKLPGHPVLELGEDEYGLRDLTDPAGADHDVLQGPPALGHQREAALAQAADGAEQVAAGPGVHIELPATCWSFTGT